MHQIMIAIDMSVSIIDRFEEINIQDLNAKSRTIADRLCQRIFCITVPISTVGQSSQGIMVGLDHEFFILLCDLLLHMHDALVLIVRTLRLHDGFQIVDATLPVAFQKTLGIFQIADLVL